MFFNLIPITFLLTLTGLKISGNNNKFYYIQLLEKDDYSSTGYAVFCHWGRVGETGSSQFKAQGVALGVATAQFNKVMKSKSGTYSLNQPFTKVQCINK